MIGSLANRIIVLCGILCLLLAVLSGLLLANSVQMRDSLLWVNHSSLVLQTANSSLHHLQQAESGQRGYTLTQNPEFAETVSDAVLAARHSARTLVELTADNPAENARAKHIRILIDQRAQAINHAMQLARKGDFAAAQQFIASGQGRQLMQLADARIGDLLIEERILSDARMLAVNQRLNMMRWLVLFGTPITLLAIALTALALIRGIRHPVDELTNVMSQLGAGERDARVTSNLNSIEFQQLAKGYNAMADELQSAVADQVVSQEQLRIANLELNDSANVLRERGEVIELLGGMAHRMQAARTDDELASIIRVFVPRVLPEIPGALYAHNNSRNLLVPIASWGGLEVAASGFAPDQCWALRRGQSHFVLETGSDIVCAHVGIDDHYHCEPLLAGGEVIGVLFLKGVVGSENRFRLTVLTENIASALVNHRLQRGLREQTIRDPLTGLFNRRYMEEALALEIARSARSNSPLSIIMCDVDHFKRFNDEFGHEAGDAVLQAVSAEMRSMFRDGDVVCRFGGEEFTIISPGTNAANLAERAEKVRQAITELNVNQGGRTLGSTTMSFGVATWEENMERDGTTLIKAADAALYRAKRNGRNQVVIDARSEAITV